jgi:hypothetical protein
MFSRVYNGSHLTTGITDLLVSMEVAPKLIPHLRFHCFL